MNGTNGVQAEVDSAHDRLRETAAELSRREEELLALELSANADSREAEQRLENATAREQEIGSAAASAESLRQQLQRRVFQAEEHERALARALAVAEEQSTVAGKVRLASTLLLVFFFQN